MGFDRELLAADIRGSLAYARALERAGIFSASERKRVEAGLRQVLSENEKKPSRAARSTAEDVHSYVEEELAGRVGTLARKLHTGRSRNDQVATDLRLFLIEKSARNELELEALLAAIVALADSSGSILMPGYTHLQRAQPVLFGHFLLAYGEMLLRDRSRLRDNVARMRTCPLGAGALSGTVYSIDREELARDLGFSAASENSMDAVSDRDFVADYLSFASILMMHLSRLAEDLILYSSMEFGFIQMHDSVASGSSLMPQKKNPDAMELIRGKSGRVFGHLVGILTVLKGLPLTYNKDLQEDKEGLFDALTTVSDSLIMARAVIDSLEVRPEAMRRATVEGFLNATELADYLVARGIPFRDAHHLVGKIVLRAQELNQVLEDLPLTVYRSFSPAFEEDLYRCLELENAVSRRREKGGTAPAAFKSALKRFKKRLRDK